MVDYQDGRAICNADRQRTGGRIYGVQDGRLELIKVPFSFREYAYCAAVLLWQRSNGFFHKRQHARYFIIIIFYHAHPDIDNKFRAVVFSRPLLSLDRFPQTCSFLL